MNNAVDGALPTVDAILPGGWNKNCINDLAKKIEKLNHEKAINEFSALPAKNFQRTRYNL